MKGDEKKIRWGVLGVARIGARMLPAIESASNATLVGVASRRPAAAAEIASCYPGARAAASYEELLSSTDIDAIYIPLPNHLHAEWAVRAAEHGKHVLCEKPLALSLDQIESIARAAEKHGVLVMEAFMYRFHPQHERALAIAASGALGEIRLSRASFSFLMSETSKRRAALPIEEGGGAMWDLGCYALSATRLFLGDEPETASATTQLAPTGADLTTCGTLSFANGRRATFDVSFECARHSEYEIIGTRGGLRCHRVWQLPGDLPELSWWTDDGRSYFERLTPANHFQLEIEGFSHSILTGQPPLITLDDSRANARAILACLQSATQGRTISLP